MINYHSASAKQYVGILLNPFWDPIENHKMWIWGLMMSRMFRGLWTCHKLHTYICIDISPAGSTGPYRGPKTGSIGPYRAQTKYEIFVFLVLIIGFNYSKMAN